MRALDDLRPSPPGLPAIDLDPPVVAESGDPFATVRIVALVARLPRARSIPLRDVRDRLNRDHLDWLFSERVVADALLQLQANWMADYRNSGGIVLEDGPGGPSVLVEDSTRVDPWIVRQAERAAAACREELVAFSLRDRPTGAD